MKTHTAHTITANGNSMATFKPTMQRGCPETKQFAISSGVVTSSRGISLVIPDDASEEATLRAIEILQARVK